MNMSCAECQDNLMALLEGLLEAEQALDCQAHLEGCAACRAEHEAIAGLQERLVARGRVSAGVSLEEPVMRAVHHIQMKSERNTMMTLLYKKRWGLGTSAVATAVAAAVFLILSLATPTAQARAAEVLARGAKVIAGLTSVHLRGQMRTLPQDNFSSLDAQSDFCTVELWKQFRPTLKWRVEKPGRVAVMDGQQTLLYHKANNEAVKLSQPSGSAFDTEWLQRLADLSNTLSKELRNARTHGWKLELAEENGPDGRPKSVVTIHARPGMLDDAYGKSSFLQTADTRRVYRFDARTDRLEAVQIFLLRAGGEVQVFELAQIEYDRPIDASLWQLKLPADVSYYQQPQVLPDNAKYAAMTPEQAARAFFEACASENWAEAGKFMSPLGTGLKEALGGLKIISVGRSFTSWPFAASFVPYEIKLKSGRVKKWNLAVRKDNAAHRWQVDGGI